MDIPGLARLLSDHYGRWQDRYPDSFPAHGAGDPLDTLVLTILSQATTDTGSLRAFRELKKRFPTWDHVADADAGELALVLRPGGLSNQKATRIRSILRAIRDRRGSLDGRFLDGMGEDEAFGYLTSFPGVGPKTAACVLLFALGYSRFPVDTHIARVAARLGLVDGSMSPVQIQGQMEELVPDDLKLELHIDLIEHGRRLCRARAPLCDDCFLKQGCPSAGGRPDLPEP